MATTHLFVELLVIGFGTLAGIILLVAAAVGFDVTTIRGELFPLSSLFPILSLAYVLGILSDRVADWIFDRWDKIHLRQVYGDKAGGLATFYNDRRILVVEASELWQFLEYGRSRLRICRGWTLNSLLILLSSDIYFASHLDVSRLVSWSFGFLNVGLGLVAFLCWMSWHKLNRKEYKKTQRQAQWVRERIEQNKRLSISMNLRRENEDEAPAE